MCGFTCLLSAAIKDDFNNLQEQRRHEIELLEIENAFLQDQLEVN